MHSQQNVKKSTILSKELRLLFQFPSPIFLSIFCFPSHLLQAPKSLSFYQADNI